MKQTSSLSEFTWCPKLPDFTLVNQRNLGNLSNIFENPLRHHLTDSSQISYWDYDDGGTIVCTNGIDDMTKTITTFLYGEYSEIFTFSKQFFNERIDFATIHSLMNYTNLIDSSWAHLPVQCASNNELIRQ